MTILHVRPPAPDRAHLRAEAAKRASDPDYTYVVWFDDRHYYVSGFQNPQRLVRWLKQEAKQGTLPPTFELW